MLEKTATDTDAVELDALIDAADQAAADLAALRPHARAALLESVASALDANAATLIPLAMSETNLTEARLTGELARTTFQLRLFAEVLRDGAYLQATVDHADAAWPMGARPDLRRTMVSIGPVAVYAASNFPFAFSVAGGDTASALAAGSPVIVKANPGHPELSRLTARIVSSALDEAGAPEGSFALIAGFEAGRALVVDHRIKAASFTGSLRGGRALFDLATGRPDPIPFFGELGSVNPAFVTPRAAEIRSEEIATGFVDSLSLGVGQFCTKPGILFVPAGSALIDLVVRESTGRAAAPMLNDHILEGYTHTLGELAGHPAVRVLAGSPAVDGDPAPTVLGTTAAEFLDNREQLMTECFGPTALVVSYESSAEVLDAARAFEGQLTASLQGESDDEVAAQLLPVLAERAGRVLWNGWPTGVSVTYAMHHGGPFPATTSPQFTSVGTTAIDRFLRPVSYQNVPQALLPEQVHDENPWAVPQRIDGVLTLPGKN